MPSRCSWASVPPFKDSSPGFNQRSAAQQQQVDHAPEKSLPLTQYLLNYYNYLLTRLVHSRLSSAVPSRLASRKTCSYPAPERSSRFSVVPYDSGPPMSNSLCNTNGSSSNNNTRANEGNVQERIPTYKQTRYGKRAEG